MNCIVDIHIRCISLLQEVLRTCHVLSDRSGLPTEVSTRRVYLVELRALLVESSHQQ